MADYTVTISLADHKQGDKWVGIASIGPVLINGSQPSSTLARVRMYFKHTSNVIFRLDSDSEANRDAPINIDNATTWEVSVPETQVFLNKAGTWSWDMEFYATGDTGPLTLYKGTITVHSDITK